MSQKRTDGMRTIDGANSAIDLAPLSRASGTTTNTTGVDVSGFQEFVAGLEAGAIGAASNVQMVVQESNESAANFTNITGASVNINTTNQQKLIRVDCRNPDRKKFMRTQSITSGGNASVYGVFTLRLTPTGPNADQSADGAMTSV